MRVLVELFDKEPIKNVLGASIFGPDVVVFLCDQRDSSLFKESAVYRFLKKRNLRTRPRFYYLDGSDMPAVRRLLAAVERDYPGCIFDFTGGRDIMLLTAAIYCAEHRLPAFHIDVRQGRFLSIQGCEELAASFEMPRFSVEELLAVTGATIHGYGHFAPSGIDEDFERDILTAFSILMKNTKAWGELVGYLQVCCAGTPPTALDMNGAKTMSTDSQLVRYHPQLLQTLFEAGLLTRYEVYGKGVSCTFKNALVKRCLLNGGIWLELYCYVQARRTHWFDEVETSLIIDWDGVEGGADTAKNEVDLLLVKGVVPVFVSCKMGLPGALALSEVKLLSTKFAGTLARTVVVTAQRLGKESRALQNRAEELGVILLDKSVLEAGTLGQALMEAATHPLPAPPRPPLRYPPSEWTY